MKRLLVAVVMFVAPAVAQMSGESEVGLNGKGGSFFSQYLFHDTPHVNVLARYFVVNGGVQRGEFAVGPTLKFGKARGTVLRVQFGADTDRDAMTAGSIVSKLGSHTLVIIGDGKWATKLSYASTFYGKTFFAVDRRGLWQLRIEGLQFGGEYGFCRLGVERQFHFSDDVQVAVAPFYDPKLRLFGVQADLRFFNFKPHL